MSPHHRRSQPRRAPAPHYLTKVRYYGDGDRVIILGEETFKIKATRATHRADWAWVVHLRRDGLISRILHIQDLSGVTDLVREAVSKTQPAGT